MLSIGKVILNFRNIPGQGDNKFVFDNGGVLLKELLERVLASRNPPSRQGIYHCIQHTNKNYRYNIYEISLDIFYVRMSTVLYLLISNYRLGKHRYTHCSTSLHAD